MNELLLTIDSFKQQLLYSINNSKLPAELMLYVLKDFEAALTSAAQAQLEAAKASIKEEDNDSTND